MQRDDLVYVGHMLDMSPKATEKVQGLGRPDYDEDENLRLALAHLVQMIGEAARRVKLLVTLNAMIRDGTHWQEVGTWPTVP